MAPTEDHKRRYGAASRLYELLSFRLNEYHDGEFVLVRNGNGRLNVGMPDEYAHLDKCMLPLLCLTEEVALILSIIIPGPSSVS